MSKRRSDENDTFTIPRKRLEILGHVMEERDILKCQQVPSLKHVASMNIVVLLWKQENMKDLLKRSLFIPGFKELQTLDITMWREVGKHSRKNVWKKMVKTISDTVCKLDLRISSLNERLISINKQLVSESLKTWMIDMSEVFHCWPNSEGKVADYVKYTVWTPFGTINSIETARCLVSHSDLSSDEKYLIACNNCLEEEVVALNAQINQRMFTSQTENTLHVTRWPMIHYWNSSIVNNNLSENYNKVHTNIRNQMFHLVQLAKSTVISRDEAAIKYFWNKLNDDKKLKAAKLIVNRTGDIGLLYYFMFKLDYEDRIKLLSHCFPSYIKNLMEDRIWGNHFLPILHRFWDRMEKKKFISLLEYTAEQMKSKKHSPAKRCRYKQIFTELWTCVPKNLKKDVCSNSDNVSHMLFFLPWKHNKDLVRMIFTELEDVQRKRLMESSSLCRQKLANYLNKEKWDMFETSLPLIFRSEEEIFLFKKSLIKEKGLSLAECFVTIGGWDKEREFLKWFFQTENVTYVHNKKLLNKYICDKFSVSLEIIENCTVFKYFLNWGNELNEDVKTFMIRPENISTLTDVTLTFINQDRLKECSKFINWCFSDDKPRINEFKLQFYTTCRDDLIETVGRMFRGENTLDFLINLEYLLFEEKARRNRFKLELLNSRIWCQLVCQVDLELANRFLKWCFQGNINNVREFKNREFNGEEMRRILQIYSHVHSDRRSFLTRLIEWFNPSDDVIKKHEELFFGDNLSSDQYKEVIRTFITNRTYLDGYPQSPRNFCFI